MSKKTTKIEKLILSIMTVVLAIVISSLFYIIDSTVGESEVYVSDVKVVDNTNPETGKNDLLDDINDIYKNADVDKNYLSEIKDLHDSLEKENVLQLEEIQPVIKSENIQKEENIAENIGKLAIIIDDVAFKYQVNKLTALNLPITMSFFPADKNHPHTYNYAVGQIVPMVHFPLEAINFKNEEIDTLHVGDSYNRIKSRVNHILEQFPNLKFTNNHTGSSFTSDYTSMKRLLSILKDRDIQFVDSVTTSKSVVRKISNELGIRYLRRDIFIDNILEVPYILKQLKKAIAKAKKNGYAIAIGHPHKATIKALSQIAPLLNDVTLVLIDDI